MMARRRITLDDFDHMEIDDGGRLYWEGREVVTTVSLPRYVNLAIVAGAGAAVVAALWPIGRFFCYGS